MAAVEACDRQTCEMQATGTQCTEEAPAAWLELGKCLKACLLEPSASTPCAPQAARPCKAKSDFPATVRHILMPVVVVVVRSISFAANGALGRLQVV